MNMAKAIAQQLIETGKVSRGSLGLMVQDLTPPLAKAMGIDRTGGAVVAQVSPHSPAAKAGIQVGDVITSLDGDPVNTSAQLRNAIGQRMPEADVHVTLLRDGKEQTVTASLDPVVEKEKQAAAEPQGPHPKAPMFGITPGSAPDRGVSSNDGGIYVTKVDPGSAAAHAGIEEGDVIVSINRVPLNSASDLARIASERQNDKPMLLQVKRKGALLFMAIG
jgi:S1-C subfamily serine protease